VLAITSIAGKQTTDGDFRGWGMPEKRQHRRGPRNQGASDLGLSLEDIRDVVENRYENVYWLLRIFVGTDQFGGIGNRLGRDSGLMLALADALESALPNLSDSAEDIEVARALVLNTLLSRGAGKRADTKARLDEFCEALWETIVSLDDFYILAFTLRHVLVPTNMMIQRVPKSDLEFAQSVARTFLEQKGEKGVAGVINIWDDVGLKGSMKVERAQVVIGFDVLRKILEERSLTPRDSAKVLTAFVQEFERRLSRGIRPQRAGASLQDVTGFILDFFNIKGEGPSPDPEHITRKFEMDRIVTNRRGHRIGISCKRTLRERFKQATPSSTEVLEAAGIREVWQVITFDKDLSADKVRAMGKAGCFFYLPDNSARFIEFTRNPDTSHYVRPLSGLVSDLKSFVDQ
jgi:hypothetical protein